MDGMSFGKAAADFLKKYRYVALVLLAGLFLMALPEQEREEEVTQITPAEESKMTDTQDALAEILSQLDGAGEVRVLLTQAAGETTVYQTDDDTGTDTLRTETVILSDSERGESGLIRQVNPPVYQGAVVLCQGADSAAVRLSIVEAVSNATGLTADKISVLKMK